jgi:hypothetical protein
MLHMLPNIHGGFHALARDFHVPPMFFILILINQSKKINLPLMVLKITKKNLFESMKKLLDP